MDTLAHSLWSVVVGKSGKPRVRWYWLALVGAGPDLVWLPFTLVALLTSGRLHYFQGPYNISHSLVVWLVVTLTAMCRWRRANIWTWPWALHIVVDIPGHQGLLTPFLWPISNFAVRGWFEWLDLRILLVNYFVLAAFFLRWYFKRRGKSLV